MSKQVVLRLNKSIRGDYQVIAEIGDQGFIHDEFQGALPNLSNELCTTLKKWRREFNNLEFKRRLRVVSSSPERSSRNAFIEQKTSNDVCIDLANRLREQMRMWLDYQGFREIVFKMQELFSNRDEIQIIICTDEDLICRLPWHYWSFVEQHESSEIAFSTSKNSYSINRSRSSLRLESLRILSIFGDDSGISLAEDEELINKAFYGGLNVRIKCLKQPSKYQLNRELREHDWDVLFFAGHSESSIGRGIIYLGNGSSIELDELRSSLNHAVLHGLKIAFFNSCDGLEIAKELQDLQIPQTIVMRESVPDQVAHKFLSAYIDKLQDLPYESPVYLAERFARERISALNEFPCADWLPVVFQNRKTLSPIKGQIPTWKKPEETYRRKIKDTSEATIFAEIQTISPSCPCKVIATIDKWNSGKILHSGCVWRAQVYQPELLNLTEPIDPGEETVIVARRGNLYFVVPENKIKIYESLHEEEKSPKNFLGDSLLYNASKLSDKLLHILVFGLFLVSLTIVGYGFQKVLNSASNHGSTLIPLSQISH